MTPSLSPDQRNRHRVFTDGEDDRVMALDKRELIDGNRNCVGARDLRHAQERPHFHLAMLARIERFDGIVEQRQVLGRGGSRHRKFSPGAGLTALLALARR